MFEFQRTRRRRLRDACEYFVEEVEGWLEHIQVEAFTKGEGARSPKFQSLYKEADTAINDFKTLLHKTSFQNPKIYGGRTQRPRRSDILARIGDVVKEAHVAVFRIEYAMHSLVLDIGREKWKAAGGLGDVGGMEKGGGDEDIDGDDEDGDDYDFDGDEGDDDGDHDIAKSSTILDRAALSKLKVGDLVDIWDETTKENDVLWITGKVVAIEWDSVSFCCAQTSPYLCELSDRIVNSPSRDCSSLSTDRV